MQQQEIYGISLKFQRPRRHQDCGQQKLVWPGPHWHRSHRPVCADDALKGSTWWTPSYSCSAAIDDFVSTGRHLERSSTIDLVKRLIIWLCYVAATSADMMSTRGDLRKTFLETRGLPGRCAETAGREPGDCPGTARTLSGDPENIRLRMSLTSWQTPGDHHLINRNVLA